MRAELGRRVVISGIGVVSPFGVGRERFWQQVTAGCSSIRAITEFDVSTLPCRIGAPVPPVTIGDAPPVDGEDNDEFVGRGHRVSGADPRRYSKASLIGVIAAREAWRDAGLSSGEAGAGVIVGSGAGGIDIAEREYAEFFRDGGKRVTPYAIPLSIVGMVSSEISISLRLRGISHVVSTGCTSSTDAIGYGAALIRSGEADALLAGGVDACLTLGMMFGFAKMRVMPTRFNDTPTEASRPFDRDRAGFVLGEGAWMLVLEREDRARARGARPYAVVEGYGSTCDAYHRVQMDPGRRGDRRRDAARPRPSGPSGRGGRIREFPRHVHRTQRRDRIPVRPSSARAARRSRVGVVDQVDDWSPSGSQRGCGGGDRGAGPVAEVPAPYHQSDEP